MKKNKWFIVTLVIVIACILFVNLVSTVIYLPKVLLLTILKYPLSFSTKTLNDIRDILEYQTLRKSNMELERTVNILTGQLSELREVADENKRLRKLLALKDSMKFETVAADVIGKDISDWRFSILLNRGSKDGIKVNTVVNCGKGLAGRAVEVYQTMSRVMLITDPNSKVAVLIQTTREEGLLLGLNNNLCLLKYLPLDTAAKPGDKLITSGGSIYPKGVLVGYIIRVEKDPSKLYSLALVKPAADFSRLEEVLCITGN